jgi:HlyD family secretion protein
MKRAPFIVLAALVALALATRGLWQDRTFALLGIGAAHDRYLGYVEGETALVGPPIAGRLVERPVNRGDHVKKGDRLFIIDPVVAQAEVARAEGLLAEAKSRYENLLTGKRPEEKAITSAQRRETEAALAMAETEYKRQSELLAKGVGTRKDYENAESTMLQLRMRQASLVAQEQVNDLPARPDEIDAAKAQIDQDQANLAQAKKRLDELMPVAPEDALVENTFYNVGEWVAAGSPVVSLLPPSRVKLRFFVPQDEIAQAQMGRTVFFTCDGCPRGLKASIIYVSPRAEFTPPVIYSETARTKLIFMIEARPDAGQTPLSPGLPVSVTAFVDTPQ